MAQTKNTKKTISQWVGVIFALASAPLMFAISIAMGQVIIGDNDWGALFGIGILCIGIYLFVLIVSKITYFIIK